MEDNRLANGVHLSNKTETVADTGEANAKLVSITSLKPDPNQPRKVFANLLGLAETINLHGIMQPIVVDENLTIIFGERRWRAAKLAGLKEVPVIVKKGLEVGASDDRLIMQLVEDVQDEELTPLERAAAWEKLKRLKCLTNLGLAKLLGISERHVYRVLSLNSLPPEMKGAIEQGKISVSQLMDIRSLPLDEQMEAFRGCLANPSPAKNYSSLKANLSEMKKRLWKGRQKSRGFIGKDMLRLLGAEVSATNKGAVVTQGKGESFEHFTVKAMVYKVLKDLGRETGCEMEVCGSLADIADLSSGYVYEVESNPSPSKVLRKVEAFKGLSGFRDVLVIDLRKLPASALKGLKEAEAFLRAKMV